MRAASSDTPTAIGCPPQLSSISAHLPRTSTRLKPGMLRPEPLAMRPSRPAPVAPPLPPAPVAPLAAPAPAQVAEVGALPAEVGELLAVYRALEGGGPLLALGAVVAFAAFKASKRGARRDEAPHSCPLAPRLDELARRVEAVEARPVSAPACSASELLALVGGAVKGGEAREDKGASA